MKIKSHVKAGEHCHNALRDLMQNPGDGSLQIKFCQCCASDPYCLR